MRTLLLLMRIWPRRFARLLVLYATDEAFRELALGYSDAVQAGRRWQYAGQRGEQKVAEYRRLAEELECDLKDRIEGNNNLVGHD